jgi:hypothetical protein
MAYIASSDVKAWSGVPDTDTADDAELALLIARAQKYIDEYTGRVFESTSDNEQTRYFTAAIDVEGATLWLDKDLNSLGSNGIIAGTDTLASTDYVTEPRSDKPYYALTLTDNTPEEWGNSNSDGDYENAIQISGQWAYSSAAPADIQYAALRLTKWYYKQGRLTDETADRPIVLESGATVLPSQIPADVKEILDRYRYRPVRS